VVRDEDLDRANHLVAQIQSAQPDSAPAHDVKAILLGERGQWEASIAESEAAIGDDRNLAAAYAFAGFRKVFIGRAAEGFAGVETALRLSPRDPQRYLWELFICHLHAHLAHWDQAIEWCGKSIADNANFWFAYVDLAAANVTGRDTAAQAAVADLLRLMPEYTVQKWLNTKWSDDPTFIREYQRIAQGLRKAGLSEGEVKSN
jgi:adenylate cyclase